MMHSNCYMNVSRESCCLHFFCLNVSFQSDLQSLLHRCSCYLWFMSAYIHWYIKTYKHTRACIHAWQNKMENQINMITIPFLPHTLRTHEDVVDDDVLELPLACIHIMLLTSLRLPSCNYSLFTCNSISTPIMVTLTHYFIHTWLLEYYLKLQIKHTYIT